MMSDGKNNNLRSFCWTLPLFNILFGLGICLIHFHDEVAAMKIKSENDMHVPPQLDYWGRLTSGPIHWTTMDKVLFVALIMLLLEVLNFICGQSGELMGATKIPVRGKHLDELSPTDQLFIGISKAQTGPFLYILLRYCFQETYVLWTFDKYTSIQTILLPLPVLFIVYDFFYTILHWFLHIKAIYPFIHKHHHHQKAPSRATDDAVNVHPVEFTLGEYNHLWTIFLCCRVFHMKMHILSVLFFLAIGGVLAGWNHTRFDVTFSLFGKVIIFDSKAHDVHHRIPQSNYGQYTMFWDHVFGSYRSYDPTDRVNPKAQLNPKTGKSLNYEYIKERSSSNMKMQ